MIQQFPQSIESALQSVCSEHYGLVRCPHCRRKFNLKEATPTFLEKLPHNDVFVYVMCPDCHSSYQTSSIRGRKAMNDKCFLNVKVHGLLADNQLQPFAVTSILTLLLNQGSLTAAIENGHGLTRSDYFALCASANYGAIALGDFRATTEGGGE